MLREIKDISFKDGFLYLKHNQVRIVVRGWPNPTARKQKNAIWNDFHPELKLIKTLEDYKADAGTSQRGWSDLHQDSRLTYNRLIALKSFSEPIPDVLCNVLIPFNTFQWDILHALYRLKQPMLDLIRSNPALGYMLSINKTFRRWLKESTQHDQPQTLIQQKQRTIAHFIGLPDSKTAVTSLKKISAQNVHSSMYPLLLYSMNAEPSIKMASHCKRLHIGVLKLLAVPELSNMITPNLISEVEASTQEEEFPFTATLLLAIIDMKHQMRIETQHRFTSCTEVQTMHEDTQQQYQEYQTPSQQPHPFLTIPTPPLPGNKDIVPLLTVPEFIEEGKAQHNCVASYCQSVSKGRICVYKVLYPERATLSICRNIHGKWIISELKAACNQPVKGGTLTFVQDWLS